MRDASRIIYSASLFDPAGIVDIGIITGSWLGKNAGAAASGTVVTGRDGRQVSRLARRAFVAGLTGFGYKVLDLRLAPEPVVLWKVKEAGGLFGFYFFCENDTLYIKITSREDKPDMLDSLAELCVEKKSIPDIKHSFPVDSIGTIYYDPTATGNYSAALSKHLTELKGIRKIRREGRKRLLFDCRHSAIPMLMETLSTTLDVEVEVMNGGVVGTYEIATEEEFHYKLKNSNPPFAAGVVASPQEYCIYRADSRTVSGWAKETFTSFEEMLPSLVKLIS